VESDDATRSATLQQDFQYLDSQPYGKQGFYDPPGIREVDFQRSLSSGTCKGTPLGQPRIERFVETDHLPVAPKDPFFSFALTTLIVLCESPHSLMNHFLEFLRLHVVAQVLKINRTKFCIKADVFLNSMMCTLKVRAYQQEPGQIAFEFQRRSGDTITFNDIYKQAALFLKERYSINRGIPDSFTQPQRALPLPKGKVEVAHWQPLLELARQVHSPQLQAEAASSMLSLAEDRETIDALCTEGGVIDAVKQLLKTDRVDVCYPTAKLLLQLACSDSAMEAFFGEQPSSQGLMQILLEKVQLCSAYSEMSMMVQQLLQVITTVVRNCAHRMPQSGASLLTDQISQALSKSSREHFNITESLQEAYLVLVQRQ
jgi:hypothetical protein